MRPRVMRRAALVLALMLGGCSASARDTALDLSTAAGKVVARVLVRAAGLCDDPRPAPPSSGGDVVPRDGGAEDGGG